MVNVPRSSTPMVTAKGEHGQGHDARGGHGVPGGWVIERTATVMAVNGGNHRSTSAGGDTAPPSEPVDRRLGGFVGRGRQQQPAAWRAGQRDDRAGQHPHREKPLHLAGQTLGELDRTDLGTGAQQDTGTR